MKNHIKNTSNKFLSLDIQFFAGGTTIYELKQNLSTLGQQVAKIEGELTAKAIDPTATASDIKDLQNAKADMQARFDVIKAQHDQMEKEQADKFRAQQTQAASGLGGATTEEGKLVAAKAEFIRATIQGRPISDEAKAIIALPTGNPSGGDKFFPTNLQRELVHEPFAKNQLREITQQSAIKGLELPKIAYQLDDDDFSTNEETAKEMALKGDVVTFGRNKFKVMVKIADTIIHGTDVELTQYTDNALRSGLAAKEKKDALTTTPKSGLEYMSFFETGANAIKQVEGEDLFEAITNAIADLHEDYRENAKVVMSYKDYLTIIKSLSNGTTNFFDTPPEKVLGKPVTFIDGATSPIVGDFNYFRINYDAMTYDTAKDVKTGEYLFVLTAWYDQKRSLNSPFRIAKVDSTP